MKKDSWIIMLVLELSTSFVLGQENSSGGSGGGGDGLSATPISEVSVETSPEWKSLSLTDTDGFPEEFSLRRDALQSYWLEQAVGGNASVGGPTVVPSPGGRSYVNVVGKSGEDVLGLLSSSVLSFRVQNPAESVIFLNASLTDENGHVLFSGSKSIRPKLGKGGWVVDGQDVVLNSMRLAGGNLPFSLPGVDAIHVISRDPAGNVIGEEWYNRYDKDGKFRIDPYRVPQIGDVILTRYLQNGDIESKGYRIADGSPTEKADMGTNFPMAISGVSIYTDLGRSDDDPLFVAAQAPVWESSPVISLTLTRERDVILWAVATGDRKDVVETASAVRVRLANSFDWSPPWAVDVDSHTLKLRFRPGKYYFIFEWERAFKPEPAVPPIDGGKG